LWGAPYLIGSATGPYARGAYADRMSNDPQPDNTLPGDLDDEDLEINNDLPEPEKDKSNQGKSAAAKANAPGQQKKPQPK